MRVAKSPGSSKDNKILQREAAALMRGENAFGRKGLNESSREADELLDLARGVACLGTGHD